MKNLLFSGNTTIVMGYASFFEDKTVPDIIECHPVAPVIATAPRTGQIVALRTNIPLFGCVMLGKLRVGDRTIYEASPRPPGYVGMCGIETSHPTRDCKRIATFTVEEGRVVTADLSYSGVIFPYLCRDFQYSLELEWLYKENVDPNGGQ